MIINSVDKYDNYVTLVSDDTTIALPFNSVIATLNEDAISFTLLGSRKSLGSKIGASDYEDIVNKLNGIEGGVDPDA